MNSAEEFYAAQAMMAQANLEVAQAKQALAAAQLARFSAAPSSYYSSPVMASPQPIVAPVAPVAFQKTFQTSPPLAQQSVQQSVQQHQPQEVLEEPVEELAAAPGPIAVATVLSQPNLHPAPRGRTKAPAPYLAAAASAPEVAPPAPEPAPTPTRDPAAPSVVRSNAPKTNKKPAAQADAPAEEKRPPPTFYHYCARVIKEELGDPVFKMNKLYTFAEVKDKGYCTHVEPIVLGGRPQFVCREFAANNFRGNCDEHYQMFQDRLAENAEKKAEYEARQAAREQREQQRAQRDQEPQDGERPQRIPRRQRRQQREQEPLQDE